MRIATDTSLIGPHSPLVPMLVPLVSRGDRDTGQTSWDRRYENYELAAQSLFEVVAIGDADVVVIPIDWYWVRGRSWATRPNRQLAKRCRQLANLARHHQKPIVVFFGGDRSCDRVSIPDSIVLREGAFKSRLTSSDVALPAFAEDLVEHFCKGQVVERAHSSHPVVGFCGLAGARSGLKSWLKLMAFRAVVAARERRIDPSPYLGETLRSEALQILAQRSDIESNFIVRDSSVFFRDANTLDLVDVRQQYVENMINCDYVLCLRGSGNYSYRVYEAMCMGRIPILVDTDCALPFPDQIDWKGSCVWVEHGDLPNIAQAILDFHRRLSPEEFSALQHANRQTWLTWLSPLGFFEKFESIVHATKPGI